MKVMQIGYGYWGTNITKKLLSSSMFELIYLVETDDARRQIAQTQVPGNVIVLKEYKQALQNDIEAVVICTQTEYSYDIAMEAMKFGKHVFMEKPIATTVDRTKKLIACAGEKKLIWYIIR